jgi:alkanesulfonate monooxygenase SsuD/methylene tetrahydromethanopterin reductase-like flavin-dependent oxidoreductase (luciferase family)
MSAMTAEPAEPAEPAEFHLYLPQMRMTPAALEARALAAEAAGFVGMAGMDHLAPPRAEGQPMFEAITTATWLAARTERLVQGNLVLCDAFRHPVVLARQAVTLDHFSGGRFELGLGWGSVGEEFVTYGISPANPAERVDRLRETLELLELLWSGEQFDYRGRWFTVTGGRQVPTPLERIPLVVGGTGPKTMRLVARHADWWNVSVDKLQHLDGAREAAGDARVSTQVMVAFVPSEDRRAEITEIARKRFNWRNPPVVGSAGELVDHFAAARDGGVDRFYVWFTDFASPETLAAFGAGVIGQV